MAVEEKCELVGFLSPYTVNVKNGKIVSVTFTRNEETDDGQWVQDKEQLTTLKANFLISAFGSGLDDKESKYCLNRSSYKLYFPFVAIEALKPLKLNSKNLPEVASKTMSTSHPLVWCGGDVAGIAETTVESVNDGKVAAWYIHCALEVVAFRFPLPCCDS